MPNARVKRTLWLVDDSREYAAVVERAFHQADAGVAVFPIADGQTAIERLALCGVRVPMPDLVLLARELRGGPDGYQVLRAVRSLERLAALPVLMMSGSDDEEHVAAAMAAGATAYVIKPVVKEDYGRLVRDILPWLDAENPSEVGPKAAGSCLALTDAAVGSSPTMALSTDLAAFMQPLPEEPSLMQKLVSFVDWVKETATAAQDPFQVAFARACRAHRITQAQAMRAGGSHQLLANRRAVVVDLIVERWPDETILEAIALNGTEFKRLKAVARAKVGPKLDRAAR